MNRTQFLHASLMALSAGMALGAVHAGPAAATVIDRAEHGFTVAHSARVAKTPAEVWDVLRAPQTWWSAAHSWSGDAANFYLDMQAGGCFCEQLPAETGATGATAPGSGRKLGGSVQHARVLFVQPGRMLRLSGALGPLQGEAMTGTLTIQIKPNEGGSSIRFDYVVGGYARFSLDEVAPAVDAVLAQQLLGLANALGGAMSVPVPAPAKDAPDKAAPPQDDPPSDPEPDAPGGP